MKHGIAVLAFCFSVMAITRFDSSKVIIPDTIITKVRNDSLKFVIYDTLKIKETLKDTTLIVRIDTVKSSSKPIPVVAPVIKKVK